MRPRTVDVRPFPSDRRIVLAALRSGRSQFPMHGLTSLDITDAWGRLSAPPGLSLTAFVVAAVAGAVAQHPEVAAYRDWRGRLVVPRYVDVATMVEVQGPDGLFPLAHVLRDADVRSVTELSAELRSVKASPQRSESGRLLRRWTVHAARIPGILTLMYAGLARFRGLRRRAGTVAVTSVGMFTGGSGFGVGTPTIMTLTVLVGGSSDRPAVHAGEVVVRRMLDLTVSIDHRIVDGAPAARFGAELRRRIESAHGLF